MGMAVEVFRGSWSGGVRGWVSEWRVKRGEEMLVGRRDRG